MRRFLTLLSAGIALACSSSVQAIAPCEPIATSGNATVEVVDGNGRKLASYGQGGQVWVLGQMGDRYAIRIRNSSGERIEAVVSVDGRDAIDGKSASWQKRGYLVQPWGEILVDGFRVSNQDVAAFRFSSISDSYASRTGSARDVGVIGVAIFRERYTPPPPPAPLEPWGYDDGRRGDSKSAPSAERSADRPATAAPHGGAVRDEERGLGTAFGERRSSPVREVSFERASYHPTSQIALRYDDARGLQSQGIGLRCDPDDGWRRRTAKPFVESPGPYAAPPPGWSY